MARMNSRYSNILNTPSHSLLNTPTITTTPIVRQHDTQSFISTITLSPLPSFLERGHLFSDSGTPQNIESDSPETAQSGQTQRLRLWRHDALSQHQYEAAAFIGDKILARTREDHRPALAPDTDHAEDPNDAFWLAQCYYNSGHYARARNLLVKQSLLHASVACRCLAAQCLVCISPFTACTH